VPNVYARTLQRAAEIAGGEQQLALRLKVTPSYLALWLRDSAQAPPYVFLRAVDLLLEHEVLELSKPAIPPGSA
jgi:meiotically up-regulated gene 157 (Mug157) protein